MVEVACTTYLALVVGTIWRVLESTLQRSFVVPAS